VKRGLARVALRLSSLANEQENPEEALLQADDAERLELAETSDPALRDWSLLVRVELERLDVCAVRGDGPAYRASSARLAAAAEEWHARHPDDQSRYFRVLARIQGALGQLFSGEPTRAIAQMSDTIELIRGELARPNPHIWLANDLRVLLARRMQLHSGTQFPSRGDPAAAIRASASVLGPGKSGAGDDASDMRSLQQDAVFRVVMLPARSQWDAADGLREFEALREVARTMDANARHGVLDAAEYLSLALGGTRALRRLGRAEQAGTEAREALARLTASPSPVVWHAENLLRFEQALLGIDVPGAVETARRHLAASPASLVLRGDVVKILGVSGAGDEAGRVLSAMPACEYRRRLEKELAKKSFLD